MGSSVEVTVLGSEDAGKASVPVSRQGLLVSESEPSFVGGGAEGLIPCLGVPEQRLPQAW